VSVLDAVKDAIGLLESLGCDYLIGGSFASGAWGNQRMTQDLDVSLVLEKVDSEQFLAKAQEKFIIDPFLVHEALGSSEPYRGFQMIHDEEMFKIDVFLANPDPLTQSEFARKRRIEIVPGLNAYCASAEDIALQKLRWYELGNRASDRQWNDVMGVIEVQGDQFDRAYFLDWADKLGLGDLSREALAEARI